jgi:hypothetical protein
MRDPLTPPQSTIADPRPHHRARRRVSRPHRTERRHENSTAHRRDPRAETRASARARGDARLNNPRARSRESNPTDARARHRDAPSARRATTTGEKNVKSRSIRVARTMMFVAVAARCADTAPATSWTFAWARGV